MKTSILKPVKQERVSPEEFLKITTSKNIQRSRFIPPKLGDNTFGCFEVTYRFPELRNG